MSLKIELALWLQQPHELQTAGASRRRPVVALVWIDEEKMPFVRCGVGISELLVLF